MKDLRKDGKNVHTDQTQMNIISSQKMMSVTES